MSANISHLPLQSFGLDNIPAVPFVLTFMEPLGTVLRLAMRGLETLTAKDGLSNTFTIGGFTGASSQFLFGTAPIDPFTGAVHEIESLIASGIADLIQRILESDRGPAGRQPAKSTRPLTGTSQIPPLPLDDPSQFSLSWTNFSNVYKNALPQLPVWASSLTSVDAATEQFWPTIANHGSGYNLIILEAVDATKASEFKALFGNAWTREGLDAIQAEGRLYAIDLRIFDAFLPATVDNLLRFTPGAVVLLEQNTNTKALKPLAVRVSSQADAVVYAAGTSTSGAWLYALQAAKTAVTVYGIWLGHVYHWHIVTAAMQMTFYNNVPDTHPVYQLLEPQANFLIGFNEVLLLLWSRIAPPTSFDNPMKFLQLMDRFASGRNFFDDDPLVAIQAQGLKPENFTKSTPWDEYPVVQNLLEVWNAVEAYVKVFVETTYATDAAVANDGALQSWMKASADPAQGNVRGLPAMTSKAALQNVLTSLIYRVTAHGISRLNNSINPVMTFAANYPPCLQSMDMPAPSDQLDTAALLKLLPWTNTIGDVVNFYFIFVFSKPYETLIPIFGVDSSLPFPGGLEDKRNQAVVVFRNTMIEFINAYEPAAPQLEQWPLNIET